MKALGTAHKPLRTPQYTGQLAHWSRTRALPHSARYSKYRNSSHGDTHRHRHLPRAQVVELAPSPTSSGVPVERWGRVSANSNICTSCSAWHSQCCNPAVSDSSTFRLGAGLRALPAACLQGRQRGLGGLCTEIRAHARRMQTTSWWQTLVAPTAGLCCGTYLKDHRGQSRSYPR